MADPTHFYTGWLLDPDARDALLARFPPRYPIVVAHHVTLKFGDETAQPPAEVTAEIVGAADDGAERPGPGGRPSTPAPRGRTSGTFHITWSLAEGREARESNAVITQGWAPLPQRVAVRLIPKP